MAEKNPVALAISVAIVAAGAGIAWGALKVHQMGTPGMHFLGKLLGLVAFLVIMAGIAASVFGFGVDFR